MFTREIIERSIVNRTVHYAVSRVALVRIVIFLTALAFAPLESLAYGEIYLVRAPEEIHEGDDVTIFVTASPVDTNINRILAVSYPESWKVKKSWAVLVGYDDVLPLPTSASFSREITTDASHKVVAFADTNFSSDVAGIAYFITFATDPAAQNATTATVKAGLVERIDPNSAPEIDKKTKKPKPRNTEWKMVFPGSRDLSLAHVSGKRIAPQIKLIRGWRATRGLALRDSNSSAVLKTDPRSLSDLIGGAFSIEMWFRTASAYQPLIRFATDDAKRFLNLATNSLGQIYLFRYDGKVREILAGTKAMAADGQWHHFVMTYDAQHKLRFYLDAQQLINRDVDQKHFAGITGLQLGHSKASNDLELDELRFFAKSYHAVEEFAPFIARSARDTMTAAFGLFHFDDFGQQARSNKPLYIKAGAEGDARSTAFPMLFELDSNARITETTSPVQTDQVLLTADMITPTRVSINWKVTSELDVVEYALERRVGSFGEFEEVIGADAKRSIKQPKRGQSLISRASYSVMEDLPRLKGDIDLYYRIAVVTSSDSVFYSEPVKLEYGEMRDVFVEQNDPNPFNPTTTLAFRLVKPAHVRMAIYDIIGREIVTITNGKLDAGRHKFVLDAANWPGGIYFYKVKTANSTVTRKMVLAK